MSRVAYSEADREGREHVVGLMRAAGLEVEIDVAGYLIFVPSVGGTSHSPREHSRPEDITAGATVLLQALLRLDDLNRT